MKIALINDTHFGIRNDSSFFLNHFLDFFETQFFPYIKDNDIKTIFHLGDLLDRRKYVNIHTLNKVKKRFIEPLTEMGIEFHMIVGNHDMYYRNTNEINSANELFSDYSNFHLHSVPYTFEHDGLCIGLVPWICSENESEVLDYIKNCKCPIVAGHFELSGHQVLSGVNFKDGMSDKIFSRFEAVLSGHFHLRSQKNNVNYLGTQYEMTYADSGTQKGFSVLDTETRDIDFIENIDQIFYVISTEDVDENFNYSELTNKYVKLIINSNTSKKKSESIVLNIDRAEPFDFTVIEDTSTDETEKENVDLSKDTITIINEEIESFDDELDKLKLKKLISDIYIEALNS